MSNAQTPLSPDDRETLAGLWRCQPPPKFREVRAAFEAATGRRLSTYTLFRYRPAGAGRRQAGRDAVDRLGVRGPIAEAVRHAALAATATTAEARMRGLLAARRVIDRQIDLMERSRGATP